MAISEDMKKIAENIASSYDVRVKALGELVSDTHRTLKGFANDRKKLADFVNELTDEVGSMLSSFEKQRNEMSKELKDKLAKEISEIEHYVANKLKEFNNAHADMSEELRKDLAKYVEGIVSETRKLLREYGSDMAQARKVWRQLCATMAKARKGGVMPKIEAGEDVSTVEQAVRKSRSKKGKSSRKKVEAGV